MTAQPVRVQTARPPAWAALAWLFPCASFAMSLGAAVLQPPTGGLFDVLWVAMLVPLAFGIAGAVVASRRPRNGIGWVLCVFSLSIPFEVLMTARMGLPRPLGAAGLWMLWLVNWAWIVLVAPLVTYLPLTFPHGRIRGRGARATLALAALATSMIAIGNALDPELLYDVVPPPVALHGHDALLAALTGPGTIPLAAAMLLSLAAAVRHYRASAGVVRQQFKCFLAALLVAVAAAIANSVLYRIGNATVAQVVLAGGLLWLPVAIGVAVLKYRLYDIERIISRTVSYGTLTVLLAAIYLAAVTALTALTAPVAGESPVAVAAATLAAAAAFGPARRRIQAAVDRRFNRTRYDARQMVEGFAAHTRDDVDLEQLALDLQRVSAQALQPAATALWLRRVES